MTDIRKLLNQAITSHIRGDADATKTAFKQVVQQKAKSLVAESVFSSHQGDNTYGPFPITLEDGDVEGVQAGQYDIMVTAEMDVQGRYTQGNFSSRAADPDEYYGEEPDFELRIEAIEIYPTDDDKLITTVTGPQATRLTPEEAYSTIYRDAMELLNKKRRDYFDEPY